MKSMTGFGRGEASGGGFRYAVEIACVNRKGADVAVNLPRDLQALEPAVRAQVGAMIARGRANVSVKCEADGEAAAGSAAVVDAAAAKALDRAMRELSAELGRDLELTAADLIRAGAVTIGAAAADPEAAAAPVAEATAAALEALEAMQRREGDHLRAELEANLGAVDELVAKLAAEAPAMVARYRDSLRKRLEDAGIPLPLDDERLVKEIGIFAERCDISEELTRLTSHTAQFRGYLASGEPSGRPLDFLCQELNREFNTIGSKSNSALISSGVVEGKSLVERLREQVQNVE